MVLTKEELKQNVFNDLYIKILYILNNLDNKNSKEMFKLNNKYKEFFDFHLDNMIFLDGSSNNKVLEIMERVYKEEIKHIWAVEWDLTN